MEYGILSMIPPILTCVLAFATKQTVMFLAAVMEHRERIGGKNIALIMSGGNLDGDLLCKLLNEYQ